MCQVGIDTILAKSGCAKASLYSNFSTKLADQRDELALGVCIAVDVALRLFEVGLPS
jgi:hypothetical protein